MLSQGLCILLRLITSLLHILWHFVRLFIFWNFVWKPGFSHRYFPKFCLQSTMYQHNLAPTRLKNGTAQSLRLACAGTLRHFSIFQLAIIHTKLMIFHYYIFRVQKSVIILLILSLYICILYPFYYNVCVSRSVIYYEVPIPRFVRTAMCLCL